MCHEESCLLSNNKLLTNLDPLEVEPGIGGIHGSLLISGFLEDKGLVT